LTKLWHTVLIGLNAIHYVNVSPISNSTWKETIIILGDNRKYFSLDEDKPLSGDFFVLVSFRKLIVLFFLDCIWFSYSTPAFLKIIRIILKNNMMHNEIASVNVKK